MENWLRYSLKSLTVLAFTFLVLSLQSTTAKKIKTSADVTEETCEVCVKFLRKFIVTLDDVTLSSTAKIEDAFRKSCKKTKKDDNRFCYYIGGLEESAVGILGEMSKPISWRAPVEKVCHKLFINDNQICDLKYEKQIDLAEVNLKKLKVKELKAILSDWDESCRGCTEKQDYVKLIEDLMPKYAPESHAKRQAKNEL